MTSQAPEPSDWLTLRADAGEWGKIGGGGVTQREVAGVLMGNGETE